MGKKPHWILSARFATRSSEKTIETYWSLPVATVDWFPESFIIHPRRSHPTLSIRAVIRQHVTLYGWGRHYSYFNTYSFNSSPLCPVPTPHSVGAVRRRVTLCGWGRHYSYVTNYLQLQFIPPCPPHTHYSVRKGVMLDDWSRHYSYLQLQFIPAVPGAHPTLSKAG